MPSNVQRALDLGSGAGFPGLPLAIATGVEFTLVESDSRKCAFLREAARVTEAPIEVVHARIEDVSLPKFAVITARALAPLPELLGYATRFLATGGILLFPKGENVDAEVSQAEATWTMKVERHISAVYARGVILRISEVERA
jgi:16S rRNA (guanine527-N7)-methyltransferase